MRNNFKYFSFLQTFARVILIQVCYFLPVAYCMLSSVHSFGNNPITPEQEASAEKWMRNQSTQGFIENRGQLTDDKNNPIPDVLFKSELSDVDLYLTTGGFTYVFKKYTKEE